MTCGALAGAVLLGPPDQLFDVRLGGGGLQVLVRKSSHDKLRFVVVSAVLTQDASERHRTRTDDNWPVAPSVLS